MPGSIKQVRAALIMANELAKAHIVFVCVPVLDDADHIALAVQAQERLDKMANQRAGQPAGEGA